MGKQFGVDEIIKNQWLVKFDRKPYDDSYLRGFVLDCNDEFTLVNQFDCDAGVTGFAVIRNKTVKKYRVYNEPDSMEATLIKIKKIKSKKKPEISIENFDDLLNSASKLFDLIAVYCEKETKDACWIGRLEKTKKKTFVMLEIDPNAEWHETPTRFKIKDVTRIEFGNGYEKALLAVSEYRQNKKP